MEGRQAWGLEAAFFPSITSAAWHSLPVLMTGAVASSKAMADRSPPIALSSEPQFSLVFGGSINSAGTVAFFGQLDAGGSGIFTSSGGPTTSVALTSEGFTGFGGAPKINDAGRVIFGATLGGGNTGIFLRGGGQAAATVALTSGPMFGTLVDGTINSLGTVAFSAVLDSGSRGVFTGNGGPVATIAIADFPSRMGSSINDQGMVVFAAGSNPSVGTSILLGDGGSVTTFASISGPLNGFGIFPVINNNGTIAFLGGIDDGRVGLFTGPDPVTNKVIASNEIRFGSMRVGVIPAETQNPGAIDINDSGQIAFHYELADGRQGIAVATPTPEPTVTALILIGVVRLFHRRPDRSPQEKVNQN